MTKIICKDCGKEKKLAAKGLCRKCYNRKYREENKEHYQELNRKWYAENKGQASERYRKYSTENRGQIKESQRKWYVKNKGQVLEHQRAYHYKRLYDIALTDYDKMLEAQGNGCWVCGKTVKENGRHLCVDHNHETGETRGLLCTACNVGLGAFEDDPELLTKGIKYLLNFMTPEQKSRLGDFLDKTEKIVYNIKENGLLPRDKVSGSETVISEKE